MTKKVLCKMPFKAMMVNPDKSVAPCCAFDTKFGNFGNLSNNTITDAINSTEWKKLKTAMIEDVWHPGCHTCQRNESITGKSLRIIYNELIGNFNTGQEEKITSLEINGSNICNLSCLMCSGYFSSRWVSESKKISNIYNSYSAQDRNVKNLSGIEAINNKHHMQVPNSELMIKHLSSVDLSQMNMLSFKGGEPFLNSEFPDILEYLNNKGILQQVSIIVVTNGTYTTTKTLKLLGLAKDVKIFISIDGTHELFNYIRYGDSVFADIEPNIEKFNNISNVSISLTSTIMAYNIFNLADILRWKQELAIKYRNVHYCLFENFITSPNYLSIRVLSDVTRNKLINFYSNINHSDVFKNVIKHLSLSYSGDELHNRWIDYTLLMQEVRNNNILDIVPELKSEFTYFNR